MTLSVYVTLNHDYYINIALFLFNLFFQDTVRPDDVIEDMLAHVHVYGTQGIVQ